jgi:hypothetical protein
VTQRFGFSDPEKWMPVFRKDHAPPKIQSAMSIPSKAIALWAFAFALCAINAAA